MYGENPKISLMVEFEHSFHLFISPEFSHKISRDRQLVMMMVACFDVGLSFWRTKDDGRKRMKDGGWCRSLVAVDHSRLLNGVSLSPF